MRKAKETVTIRVNGTDIVVAKSFHDRLAKLVNGELRLAIQTVAKAANISEEEAARRLGIQLSSRITIEL